jgi:phytoene/squalene synthetase
VFTVERAHLSDDICTALQLTNFWQDVARDYEIGRVYLPTEDRQRFGYSDDDLKARRFTPAFAELMKFQVQRTRDLFQRGARLVSMMPSAGGGDVELFVKGGLAILKKIEHVRYNVWRKRPVLSKWAKVSLLAPLVWRKLKRMW